MFELVYDSVRISQKINMEIEVLNKKNNYYELYHVYEDKALGDKVVKFIGLFSSTQNAWKAIKALRHQPGFCLHSQKCFKLSNIVSIGNYEWKEGFCTVEEAFEYQKRIFRDDE